MVAHCGGSHGGDDMVTGIPGSSLSSSASGGHGGDVGLTKQALKKGPWTAAEDAILIEYVKKNGEGNWNVVQKNTSLSRCGKSCRLRWTNHLRPNLKKGSFTPEEERLILQLHAQLGNKWARMAAQLPGRTDNEIKNYWNTRIKRRIRQGLPLYPNDIGSQKQMQPTSPPMQLENQPVPSPAPALRGRPPLQIPTRTISQFLAQTSHSTSPSPSPVSLSPQSYNHLKTSFTHSLSLFDPTSPLSSTSSLASPHSPTILSPTLILNRYHQDPNTSFPGFSIAPQTPPLTLPTASSFQFNPLNYNFNSPQGLQTPQSPCTVYTPVKLAELPSNQLYMSQVDKSVPEPEAEPRYETKPKPTMSQSSDAGLIEDLLQQAEALSSNENSQKQNDLFNLQDEKFDFSLKSGYTWDIPHGSDNSSAETGMGIKNEVKQENGSMNEELSQLLQSIPSPSNIPEELNQFRDNLTMPALDFSSGAVASEDSIGLDMQQIASLFQVDSASSDISRQAASCPWDNLPRIC